MSKKKVIKVILLILSALLAVSKNLELEDESVENDEPDE